MSDPTFRAHRRRLLKLASLAPLALAAPRLYAAPQPVLVLTSYAEEVMSRFQAAFEKAHPEYRMNIQWRMPHDALATLSQPGQGGVDVYWSASPRNFAQLKTAGAWRRLPVDLAGLPDHIGRTDLRDPDGCYTATEMAGYGFACNTEALAKLGVVLPADWTDLANPRLAGRIALPNPAQVGFAPVMVDIVLQAYGWERGWALWSEIAGLSQLIDRGGPFVGEEVASGRVAVGLSIDFFVASAIANGAPIRFAYPAHGGINPAQIAVTAGAPNPAGAAAFAGFILSDAGQRLLAHPDIRKLPVRPSVYAELPAGYYDPFQAAARGAFDYDAAATRGRLGVITAAFDHALMRRHAERAVLWRRLHAAEAAGKPVAEARAALGAAPLTEPQAADPALQAQYRNQVEGAQPEAHPAEAQWRAASDAAMAKAARILDREAA